MGGTSAGAPQWAGLYALVKQSGPAALYPLAPADYRDVTSGTNGSCGIDCTSLVGYDLVTGLGSPLASSLIPAMSGGAPTATVTPTQTPGPKPGNGNGKGRR